MLLLTSEGKISNVKIICNGVCPQEIYFKSVSFKGIKHIHTHKQLDKQKPAQTRMRTSKHTFSTNVVSLKNEVR
jgi:hypothetical protein